MENQVTIRDRWLGAICYLSVFVFLPIFSSNKSEFLAKHCRQGFALFFSEVVGLILVWVISGTIGQIPLLGFIIVIILWLSFFLLFLPLTILGFVRAMFGESWRIPYLDELSDRVPIN
ncbi:MAG: hypothetical protein GY780_02845 [bacterium]|nr:hypothetical protein [bacterium]